MTAAGLTHEWEAPTSGSESDTVDDDPSSSTAAAADAFVEELLDHYMMSVISAKTFCVLCHWAAKAGMLGQVASYALPPGKDTGKYQEYLNRQLGFSRNRMAEYRLPVVGRRICDIDRTQFDLAVRPGHELLHEELEDDPSVLLRLREANEDGDLPRCYYEHPVVRNTSDDVLPVAIYIDGVAYSQSDTVLGFWLVNLITGARHVMALVRKRIVCKCGCRGWDTYFPVLVWLKWSVSCLAEGRFPTSRHDGSPWTDHDNLWRADFSGQRLAMKAAVIQLRGDWSEFCDRYGFPNWGSGLRPCFLCACAGPALYATEGASAVALGWHDNEDAEYDAACERCEIRVTVTASNHAQIVALLQYDKRRTGPRGRALAAALPGLGLRQHDRLEPTAELPDVAAFDELVDFPIVVVFWRRSEETLCQHRCPLWDDNLGLSPSKSIALDLLHTLFLGSMLEWAKFAVWKLLQAGVWGSVEGTDAVQLAVHRLRAHLKEWYGHWERSNKPERLTQITDLKGSMLGTAQNPKLTTAGLETWGFCLFLVDVMEREHQRPHLVDGAIWLESGQLLVRYVRLLKSYGKVLTVLQHQDCRCVVSSGLFVSILSTVHASRRKITSVMNAPPISTPCIHIPTHPTPLVHPCCTHHDCPPRWLTASD